MKNSQQAIAKVFTSGPEKTRKDVRYSGPYIDEVRKRMETYFAVVIRSTREQVPKAIGLFLVRGLTDKLQFELHQKVYQMNEISRLLGEPPHIMEMRKAHVSQLKILTKALNVINRDPKLSLLAGDGDDGFVEMSVKQKSPGIALVETTNTNVDTPMIHAPIETRRSSPPTIAVSKAPAPPTNVRSGGLFSGTTTSQKPLFEDAKAPATKGPL